MDNHPLWLNPLFINPDSNKKWNTVINKDLFNYESMVLKRLKDRIKKYELNKNNYPKTLEEFINKFGERPNEAYFFHIKNLGKHNEILEWIKTDNYFKNTCCYTKKFVKRKHSDNNR